MQDRVFTITPQNAEPFTVHASTPGDLRDALLAHGWPAGNGYGCACLMWNTSATVYLMPPSGTAWTVRHG